MTGGSVRNEDVVPFDIFVHWRIRPQNQDLLTIVPQSHPLVFRLGHSIDFFRVHPMCSLTYDRVKGAHLLVCYFRPGNHRQLDKKLEGKRKVGHETSKLIFRLCLFAQFPHPYL